jgi:N-methylhydantoinase A
LYEHRYAHHSPDEPVEMVNIRLAAVGRRTKLAFPTVSKNADAKPASRHKAWFARADQAIDCPLYRRDDLGAGAVIDGPALIQEHGTTTVLFAGDRCTVAPSGELIIAIGAAT